MSDSPSASSASLGVLLVHSGGLDSTHAALVCAQALDLLGGAVGEIDLGHVMRRRLRVIGSVLRSRSLEEKEAIREGFERRFWPDLISGEIRPVIDRTVSIEDVEAAQDVLSRNENIGKVIMTIPEGG